MADRGLDTRYPTAESPGLRLWQVTNRWQSAMRAALAPHDLTHVQYVLLASLVWLDQHEPEGPRTQVRLAAFAATDVMMTSQVLRALETKGLVARSPHPTDRRARILAATERGVAIANAATGDVERADAAFFEPVHDLRAFTAELSRLAAPAGLPGASTPVH